jgi:hypothetical protein
MQPGACSHGRRGPTAKPPPGPPNPHSRPPTRPRPPQGISEQSLPAELYSTYCTIEYTLNRTVQPHPPVYLFMIDVCVSEDELAACKASVMQAISTLPEYVYVGLVTFGRHVHVYELGFTDCSKVGGGACARA